MHFVRSHWVPIALFMIAIVLRLATLSLFLHGNNNDLTQVIRGDDGYFEIANNVLAGHGFSSVTTPPYIPNPLRTPGYVYFLVGILALTKSFAAVVGVQMLIAAAIPVLGMYVARRLTNTRWIGVATGTILALDPTLLALSFELYTETLFIALFLTFFLLFSSYLREPRIRALVTSAVLLGLAILVKPTVQYLPLLCIALIFWTERSGLRRATMRAGIFGAIVLLILSPWMLRNDVVFGRPALSSQTPYNLYVYLAPSVLTYAHGSNFAPEFNAFSTDSEKSGNMITPANGGEYTRKALTVIEAHPAVLVHSAAITLATFFTNDGFFAFFSRAGLDPQHFRSFIIATRLFWAMLTLAFLLGALRYLWLERLTPLTVFIIVTVMYFALTSIIGGFGANPRYRLPVDPMLIALAGVGSSYIWNGIVRIRGTATTQTFDNHPGV